MPDVNKFSESERGAIVFLLNVVRDVARTSTLVDSATYVSSSKKRPLLGRQMGKRPAYMDVTRRSVEPTAAASGPSASGEKRHAAGDTSGEGAPVKKAKTSKQKSSVPSSNRASDVPLESPPRNEDPDALSRPAVRLPRSSLWENENLPTGLRKAATPPAHFFDKRRITAAEAEELKSVQHQLLKALGVVQLAATLKDQVGLDSEDMDQLELEKKEAEEKLAQATEDLHVARAEKGSLEDELRLIRERLARAEATEESAQTELTRRQEVIAGLEKSLAAARADVARLASGVQEAFANALEQVQFKNPDVTFELGGVDVNAYVEDGKFYPAPSLAVPEASDSVVTPEEGGAGPA